MEASIPGQTLLGALRALRGDDSEARGGARAELTMRRTEWRDELLSSLHSADAATRLAAVSAAPIVALDAQALKAIVERLEDADQLVRSEACWSLIEIARAMGDAVPRLVMRLADTNWRVRLAAIEATAALGAITDRDQSLAIASCLSDSCSNVRVTAVNALSQMPVTSVRAYEMVLAAVNDPEPDVRRAAVLAARRHPVQESDAGAAAIADRLADPDPGVRIAAAHVLKTYGRDAREFVHQLLTVLESDDRELREAARATIESFGPAVLDELVQTLSSTSDHARSESLAAIANIGVAPASPVVEGIQRALLDPNTVVRIRAAELAWRLTQKLELGPLKEALDSGDAEAVRSACETAFRLGRAARPLERELVGIACGDDVRLSSAALVALARLRPTREETCRALTPLLLKSDDAAAAAARVLGAMGSAARASVPALLERARQSDSALDYLGLGAACVRAIGRIATPSDNVLEALRQVSAQRADLAPFARRALYRIERRGASLASAHAPPTPPLP